MVTGSQTPWVCPGGAPCSVGLCRGWSSGDSARCPPLPAEPLTWCYPDPQRSVLCPQISRSPKIAPRGSFLSGGSGRPGPAVGLAIGPVIGTPPWPHGRSMPFLGQNTADWCPCSGCALPGIPPHSPPARDTDAPDPHVLVTLIPSRNARGGHISAPRPTGKGPHKDRDTSGQPHKPVSLPHSPASPQVPVLHSPSPGGPQPHSSLLAAPCPSLAPCPSPSPRATSPCVPIAVSPCPQSHIPVSP